MFDPVTENFIQSAPGLPELDLEHLPQMLTDAHVKIASLRIQLLAETVENRDELLRDLGTLQRLANYYQSFVATLADNPQQGAAAFVSASAHELLDRARKNLGQSTGRPPLSSDAVSSDLAAVLLYLIAGYPSSAHETAVAVDLSLLNDPELSLVKTILAIAKGQLGDVSASSVAAIWSDMGGHEQFAVSLLWARLHQGCIRLSDGLRGDHRGFEESQRIFHEVLSLCSYSIVELLGNTGAAKEPSAISSFPGPHQLASLLCDVGGELMRRAVVNIAAPQILNPLDWGVALNSLAEKRPYLWRNHSQAVSDGFLNPGISSVIAFPTGAGKTTLAELKCVSTRLTGKKVLYLAPTHALVNQVTTDLRKSFPDEQVENSLISEGHYSETENSTLPDIAVMTPERCLALQGFSTESFNEVGLVVFDECHLLHPKEKGEDRRSLDAMLCLLGLLANSPNSDFVLLSAMIANGSELAAWIESVTLRKCVPMDLDWKPTRQARGCVVYKKDESEQLRGKVRQALRANNTKGPPAALKRSLKIAPFAFFSLRQSWVTQDSKDYSLLPITTKDVLLSATGNRPWWRVTPNKNQVSAEIAAEFARTNMKILVFVQSRKDTHAVAEQVAELLARSVTPVPPSAEELSLLEVAASEMGGEKFVFAPISGLAASHNSLLLPCEREMNELAFRTEGRVRCLACTATLAQGMNFPADLVILAGENRFNQSSGTREQLSAHDLLNAAGRAGRAGSRSSGLVLMIPDSIIEIDLEKMSLGQGWFDLKDSIFGLTDKCLTVEDPLEGILDIIETSQDSLPVDALYLFDRLPIGAAEGDESRAKAILRKSLAAFHSKNNGTEAEYEARISRAIAVGRKIRNLSNQEEWEVELALAAGVDVRIVGDLSGSLVKLIDKPFLSVIEWLGWWFLWLKEKEERKALLTRTTTSHRTSIIDQLKLGGEDLFGDRLFQTLELWMKGAPLSEIENTSFGTAVNRLAKCEKARRFRSSVVPEIAYAAGLITQVHRHLLQNCGKSDKMPISLACLSSCIREGFLEPEQLVMGWLLQGAASRPQAHKKWREVMEYAASRDDFESYGSTVSRVRAALELDLMG